VGTAVGHGASVGELHQTLVGVADESAVKGSALDPVAGRGVGDRGAFEHVSDGVDTLLNHRKPHQQEGLLLGSA
jgi:hypothetical protein